MKRIVFTGSRVSRSEYLFIQNSSNLSGSGLTALTAATSALTASYVRPGAAYSSISLIALGSNTSAWVSGGFVEVSQVTQPGLYRLDAPDAMLATGVDKSILYLQGPGMVPCVAEYQLDTDVDMDTALGIVCRGTNTANSGTTVGTLGTITSGALTNVAAGHMFAPAGLPPRIFKTFDPSTGSWTVETAFVSTVSGLAARVFGTAPGDSTIPSYATIADVATNTQILAKLPGSLTTSGNIKADIVAISSTSITGNGGTTPWGPA